MKLIVYLNLKIAKKKKDIGIELSIFCGKLSVHLKRYINLDMCTGILNLIILSLLIKGKLSYVILGLLHLLAL
jgi:hypothetical protein